MPELPEVETIKKGLEKVVIGKKITAIEVFNKKQFEGKPQFLLGKKISTIERRGKILIFTLENLFLLFHLKMSGQLIYAKKNITGKVISNNALEKLKNNDKIIGGHPEKKYEQLPNKYTRIIITFSDDSRLYFNDVRKFAWLKLVEKKEYHREMSKLGKEALLLTQKDLLQLVHSGTGSTIKQLLTNQANIAGIGNIYADEALFCAQINPFRLRKTLATEEAKRLVVCIKKILHLAIKHQGTSERFYRTAAGEVGTYGQIAQVYDRTGQPCKNCNSKIIKKKLAGRGTHFCPQCQK